MPATRSPSVPTLRELAARYSTAQLRTADAALALFAVHGVGGTSLQMIADALGVTKAAVYHQFPTKDAIVVAALEVQLAPVEAAVDDNERRGREALLSAVVDVVVANRRTFSTLQSDPVLFRLLGEHPPSLRLFVRLFDVLLGHAADDRSRVRAAVMSAAFGAVAYPMVIDLDDAVLRRELLGVLRRIV